MIQQAVRPKLVVPSADEALRYYSDSLDAEVADRYDMDGAVVFASFTVLGTTLTIKDEDDVDQSATTSGAPGLLLDVVVEDPDAVADRMVQAGAEVIFEVADRSYGARAGRVRDPFGIQWLLSTPVTG